MLPDETILSGAPILEGVSEFQVMRSNAGYYIGTTCQEGPYSRETGYFPSEAIATEALETYKRTGLLRGQRM